MERVEITKRDINTYGVGNIPKIGFNTRWKVLGLVCPYEHFIKLMPSSRESSLSCPIFGHDCPAGVEQAESCRSTKRTDSKTSQPWYVYKPIVEYGGKEPWRLTYNEFLPMKDQESGKVQEVADTQLGSWRIDNLSKGTFGRRIEQLRSFSPEELVTMVHGRTSEDYEKERMEIEVARQLIKQGRALPPIVVQERASGEFVVVDGRGRHEAAKETGVRINAWFSPLADTGKIDPLGRKVRVRLTREIAIQNALLMGQEIPENIMKEYYEERIKTSVVSTEGSDDTDALDRGRRIVRPKASKPRKGILARDTREEMISPIEVSSLELGEISGK